MDVDLLRPGTVPISPGTVLWFEFLLNPKLLANHLRNPKPDPSPTDLIVKFLSIAPEIKDIENKGNDTEAIEVKKEDVVNKRSLKNLALKILSLKVAAFLKWDLSYLEAKLPLPMQVTLLHDLMYLTLEKDVDIISLSELAVTTGPPHLVFAVILYHRWVLRAIVYSRLAPKQMKVPYVTIPGLQDANYVPPSMIDELVRGLEMQASSSIEFLNRLAKVPVPLVPNEETFIMLTEDSINACQNWEEGYKISENEFRCQLHFDLAQYHFFREDYAPVRENISKAANMYENLKKLNTKLVYCTVTEEQIKGYSNACELAHLSGTSDLPRQLQRAIRDQYTGIVSILQADNSRREIPQVYRNMLELDIQGALSSGKFTVARDLLLQVQTLNAALRIVLGETCSFDYLNILHQSKEKGVDFLISAFKAMVPKLNAEETQRVRLFMLHIATNYTHEISIWEKLKGCPELRQLFTAEELSLQYDEVTTVPNLLLTTSWELQPDSKKSARLPMGLLEQQLISSYDTKEIKDLIVKVGGMKHKRPLWKLNPKWELPIPLTSVVMSLPRGFVQDYSYILMAKARELTSQKDFSSAIKLLSTVEHESKSNNSVSSSVSYKVSKLISWETLLVQITQFLMEWPNCTIGTDQLTSACKSCLGTLQTGDSVFPRVEIQEQCAICLLNLGQWDYLMSLDKRGSHFELPEAFAAACHDILKFKGTKKVCKDAWEIVLPVFGPSPQQKRTSSGAPVHRDSPTLGGSTGYSRASLHQLLVRLRDPVVLSVALSLLARLHNVLRDEPSLELTAEYSGLWPAAVSNSNSYFSRGVGEMLSQLLLQALKYHPNNVSWLKLMADLMFVNSQPKSALRYYLKAAILVSDFFSQPLPRSVFDDLVYRRMIKCCSQMQCHTQAAIMCQFLDEVDYTTAFKSLGDVKSSTCSDSMDSYYNCIWDTTILEYLIHLHSKKGEHHRKQQAIRVIGQLELNANNNKEIQREAANIRKSRFFRSLARQFVC